MKEHSGGSPVVGYEIPLQNWDEESFPVPVEQFNFDSLDRPEDFIVEAVKRGESISELLSSIVNRVAAIKSATKIAALLSLILESKHPRMVVHQIIWVTGMTLLDGAPITELAAKYGVTKQAFEQGAMRVCEKLDLRPSRHMRSEEARENMSKRNSRRAKLTV